MGNPFSIIASDLGRTVALAKPLLMKLDNADTTARPGEGKRAKKEILGHLLDLASNNHQRFVRATFQGSLTCFFLALASDQNSSHPKTSCAS